MITLKTHTGSIFQIAKIYKIKDQHTELMSDIVVFPDGTEFTIEDEWVCGTDTKINITSDDSKTEYFLENGRLTPCEAIKGFDIKKYTIS